MRSVRVNWTNIDAVKSEVVNRAINSCNTLIELYEEQISILDRRIEEVETDNIALKTEVSLLKTDNIALKTEVSLLKTDNIALKTEVSLLKTDNITLKADNIALKTNNTILTESVDRLVKESEDRKMMLATRQMCSSLKYLLAKSINKGNQTFPDIIKNDENIRQVLDVLVSKHLDVDEESLKGMFEDFNYLVEDGNTISHREAFAYTHDELERYYTDNNNDTALNVLTVYDVLHVPNDIGYLATEVDVKKQRKPIRIL